ncbi:unnamed protein product [Toxocara canis]|uniref:Cytochrome b561 domain-containing protein n=1 Tax=Toxocara canis TaxID=6265 RepID=A0A183UGX0_TOXCA|nr:unnamed protein product [Toxocara canis]
MERLLHLWRSPPRPKHIDKVYFRFDLFLSVSQVFAFLMVILAGYYHEIADDGLQGSLGQLHYHGLYMRYALIFFQGEGLLAYRIFRHETKIMSKMVHTLMHICTFALVVAALINIVQFKNDNHISHMYSSHSWIGICLISVYLVQFAFGVINFPLPFSTGTRSSFVSSHKLVGLTIFVVSVAQSLTGSAQIPLIIHSQRYKFTQ